jgi:hypothetical protein
MPPFDRRFVRINAFIALSQRLFNNAFDPGGSLGVASGRIEMRAGYGLYPDLLAHRQADLSALVDDHASLKNLVALPR